VTCKTGFDLCWLFQQTPSFPWGSHLVEGRKLSLAEFMIVLNSKWDSHFIMCGWCLIKVPVLRIYLRRYGIPKFVVNNSRQFILRHLKSVHIPRRRREGYRKQNTRILFQFIGSYKGEQGGQFMCLGGGGEHQELCSFIFISLFIPLLSYISRPWNLAIFPCP
jgi:hypothetical protein